MVAWTLIEGGHDGCWVDVAKVPIANWNSGVVGERAGRFGKQSPCSAPGATRLVEERQRSAQLYGAHCSHKLKEKEPCWKEVVRMDIGVCRPVATTQWKSLG